MRRTFRTAPAFWSRNGVPAQLLAPLGHLVHGAATVRRRLVSGTCAGVPVICIGNLVVGGAGKTPVAGSIAAVLADAGFSVALLLRGYGGRLAGPVRVDPHHHTAGDVGDEALMLAETAPVWISRNRALGGLAAARSGVEVIVMDDGFQNPALAKSLSLVVIDGGYGFGNGRVVPAGPLREPVAAGLARADAAVLINRNSCEIASRLPAGLPILHAAARVTPPAHLAAASPVFGFAGIGRPAKFREALGAHGLHVCGFEPFPDHHRYTAREIERICRRADALGATPVTTAKDHVRLPAQVRGRITRIDLAIEWEDMAALRTILDNGLAGDTG